MSVTYVIPTHHCNLNCPHCDLKLRTDNFNAELFYDTLTKLDGEIIIFGGEPLLYKDKLRKLLSLNKHITSISSNMLLWDNEIEQILKPYPKITIASSWNPHRFTEEQYSLWLTNLKKANIVNNINITLTDDLYDYDINLLLKVIRDIDDIASIKTISFEPLVPNYDNARGDQFLCKIYDLIKGYRVKIDLRKIFGKKYCRGIYTLLPSGKLIKDCPQWYITNHTLLKECLDCKLIKICKPCKKICSCSFPKQFYDKLQHEGIL